MQAFFSYMASHYHEVIHRLAEHLWIVAVSMSAAILVGVLVGIWISRAKRWSSFVLGIAGVIQTVPSIALLGFMLPLVGTGMLPAGIALFLYALLPIIRNTYLGIDEVPSEVTDAGIGMGMTDYQLLTRVELPLALPTIFAGIRTATVINVGVATLGTYIGAGGLGAFINSGLALTKTHIILAGAIPAALLAIVLDVLLGQLQKHILKIFRPLIVGYSLLIIMMLGYPYLPHSGGRSTFRLKAGFEHEFAERADGWPGIQRVYGTDLEVKLYQAALMYKAIQNQDVDVISGYSTDGRIKAFDLQILEDDSTFFPPYYAAPLTNSESLVSHPEVARVLDLFAGVITDSVMIHLNFEVDSLKKDPSQVAKAFLKSLGYRTSVVRNGSQADFVIGTKNFTEQYILGEIFASIIENNTSLDVRLNKGMGGTAICFGALKKGDIDMYIEYTGTAFLTLLDPSSETKSTLISDPDAVYGFVKEQFHNQFGLTWMQPLGFNNTYALVMRRDMMDELGIKTISDLADYTHQTSR